MSKESFYPLILLLIPLFIMNITDEVDWSLLDFFIMGFMIVLLGFIINSISSKTKNLKKRISSYLSNKYQTNRIKLLINLTESIKFIKTITDVDSFILENNLIKKNKPRFNIRLIDDKSYPFISISRSAEWPRIKKFRGKQNKIFWTIFGTYKNDG